MEIKRGGEITIKIEDFAFGGKGISRLKTDKGDYVIFTQNAIPGQIVKAKVVKKKKSFAECRVTQILKLSPLKKNILISQSLAHHIFHCLLINNMILKKLLVLNYLIELRELTNLSSYLMN